jgi:hypothetical protein
MELVNMQKAMQKAGFCVDSVSIYQKPKAGFCVDLPEAQLGRALKAQRPID